MPRKARRAPGGIIFHVLNRGVGRREIFAKPQDYAAFERVLAHAIDAVPVALFAYCLMPNHWHLLVRPHADGDLGRFMHRLTMTHTRRWQEHYQQVGHGHLYQGRFKSFPVQDDRHFLIVARYVERNALRAKLRRRAGRAKGVTSHCFYLPRRLSWQAMARQRRIAPGGLAYHVMNRTWGRIELFEDSGDYEAFERVLAEAVTRQPPMRLCAYCLMPNHFHLVLWPERDDQVSRFMQWLTMTHAQRWHAHRHSAGRGHLYQGRFKSFAIQEDWHFRSVCRYVERNALRANLAEGAEHWRWGSAWVRLNQAGPMKGRLAKWPVPMPSDWPRILNTPQDEKELAALRRARSRGRPYGQEQWSKRTAKRLGIESSMREIGRPRKVEA